MSTVTLREATEADLVLVHHGYFTLTLTPEKAQADWYFIKRKDVVDLSIRKKVTRMIDYNGTHVYKQ